VDVISILSVYKINRFRVQVIKKEFKILIWRITSTQITLLKDLVSLKLFLNENSLNNEVFINLQQKMGDMGSVILAYKAIYTEAYLFKPIQAKEYILRMYTYLCVIHYDRRAKNLKWAHCVKEKGKSS
jgi:hypothetical protein